MNNAQYAGFPVSQLFPALRESWNQYSTFLLQADPGAGKSTILPLFLMDENLCPDKIIILEPRRMAARSLARYMSSLYSRKTGELIGYRVKGDVCSSPRARIELVTEGVFIRMIQDDPFLEGISLVIMDEFHERNLFTDLSAAFLKEVQSELRPDLKILIMSATPEAEPLKRIFPDIHCLSSEGRMYPVALRRDEKPLDMRPDNRRIIRALRTGLEESRGNVLLFLPGEREIRSFLEAVEAEGSFPGNIRFYPLYSRLSAPEQDRVLNPGKERMVIASTSIAETSLTIPGISCVIDTGLVRKPAFDANAGLSRLKTSFVSRASAQQRAGRAGRLQEGICIRLWSEQDEHLMDDFTPPEMLNADLAPLILEMRQWGARKPEDLSWIDPPPAAHYHQASRLLTLLEITGEDGELTEEGRRLSRYGTHPRLAHMLERYRTTPLEQTACALAALLTEGDWLPRAKGSDIRLRMEYLKAGRDRNHKGIRAILNSWQGFLGSRRKPKRDELVPEDCARLLCHSYPDRIAGLRGDRVYQLSGGSNCRLLPEDPLQTEDFLIVPVVGGGGDIPACFLSAPLTRDQIRQELSPLISERKQYSWDEQKNRLQCRSIEALAALNLQSRSAAPDSSDPALPEELAGLFRRKGLALLPWSKEDTACLTRLRFAGELKRCPEGWPSFDEESLLSRLDLWFIPLLIKGRLEGKLKDGLLSLLNWEQQKFLEKEVPERYQVPSGSRIRIDYSDPASPALDVRLQEVFGLMETPLLGGEIPLLFRLLNPAQRPIQITKDLKSFWDNTYAEVRKELRGRYPKHYWPENPYEGEATSRVRPRK
ncbi:MAG: ATP-dependent helicase HrpB [Spirochaetales bacterium]|nr:ATP-dependent helicase HrpB [Spirochaetales bacterium]